LARWMGALFSSRLYKSNLFTVQSCVSGQPEVPGAFCLRELRPYSKRRRERGNQYRKGGARPVSLPSERCGNAVGNRNLKDCGLAAVPLESPSAHGGGDVNCGYTDVESIEEITRGMVNTHFKQWWKRKVWNSTTPDQLTVALRKFFTFLATEKGIVNEKAMKGLQ